MIGVIFDNDGVLVDSEPLSLMAYRRALSEQGVELRQEDDWRYCGLTDADIVRAMRQDYGAVLDFERFSERKKQLYFELAERYPLRAFPGVRELVEDLRKRRIPYALASSGSLQKIQFNLEQSGLADLFPVIVSGEDFRRGKPDPEIFLCAAQRIGVLPSHCAVLEDSINGLLAARKAGCLAIGVANTFPAERLREYADIVVGSLTELMVDHLEQWLQERCEGPPAVVKLEGPGGS